MIMENTEKNSTSKNILVIEDDKDIQDSIKTCLELEGFSVFTADNGKEALEKLGKIPTPCLILLDLMMPVMNGWEFMDVISNDLMLSSIPVIIVSAVGNNNAVPKTNGYIKKPIDLDSLINTVHKHCG